MPAERYFIPQHLQLHEQLSITENEFHHLVRVMRTRPGEIVEIINGEGQLATASVQEILKDKAYLLVEDLFNAPMDPFKIILAQAIPKPNRLDFILEKGTELGVDEFWLFPGKNSVKKDFSSHQIERAHAQIIVATKQCGRLFLPKIIVKPPLEEWKIIPETTFFGDVSSSAPKFSECWNCKQQNSPVLFVVGPESGLTMQEENFLKIKGAKGVKLHENILRTDTASLVALSLIKHWLM